MPIPSRLLFPLPENNTPSGGRKFTYHVVDILNDAGIEAWVVHPRDGFRLSWFPNTTKVGHCLGLFPNQRDKNWLRKAWHFFSQRQASCIQNSSSDMSIPIEVKESDLIVIPETRLDIVHRMPEKNPKIVFNQNSFAMFKHNITDDISLNDFLSTSNVNGVITTSDLIFRWQNFALSKLPVFSAQLFIEDIFCFEKEKKVQISYMPRRRNSDAQAVMNILRTRGLDKHVKFVAIDEMPQKEVARILRETLIFMSFAEREGFGLPSAEAMASGCVVVGYTGNGGEEFFDPEYCFPVQEGELTEFVITIEKILHMNNTQPKRLDDMRLKASDTIKTRYSHENSKQSVIQAFTQVCEMISS